MALSISTVVLFLVHFFLIGFPVRLIQAVPTQASESEVSEYWIASINHQGSASFNGDSQYKVFRNVKDFGAKGNVLSKFLPVSQIH